MIQPISFSTRALPSTVESGGFAVTKGRQLFYGVLSTEEQGRSTAPVARKARPPARRRAVLKMVRQWCRKLLVVGGRGQWLGGKGASNGYEEKGGHRLERKKRPPARRRGRC